MEEENMTEYEKLKLELVWVNTSFRKEFALSEYISDEFLHELRLGLAKLLWTLDVKCESVQDIIFLEMKHELEAILNSPPDSDVLVNQLDIWIKYIKEIKGSYIPKDFRFLDEYLINLKVEFEHSKQHK